MKCPWLTNTQIETAAFALLRRALGAEAGADPEVDLDSIVYDCLAEQDSLIFDDAAVLGVEDGDYVLGRTLPFSNKILINRDLKEPNERGRQRFTIAHELGHWVLHRPLCLAADEHLDLFGDAKSHSGFVSLNREVFPARGYTPIPEEWQANRFAVALLIDQNQLRLAFVNRFGEPPLVPAESGLLAARRSVRALSRQIASATDRQESLAGLFGVSVEAMAIALEAAGYITEHRPAL